MGIRIETLDSHPAGKPFCGDIDTWYQAGGRIYGRYDSDSRSIITSPVVRHYCVDGFRFAETTNSIYRLFR